MSQAEHVTIRYAPRATIEGHEDGICYWCCSANIVQASQVLILPPHSSRPSASPSSRPSEAGETSCLALLRRRQNLLAEKGYQSVGAAATRLTPPHAASCPFSSSCRCFDRAVVAPLHRRFANSCPDGGGSGGGGARRAQMPPIADLSGHQAARPPAPLRRLRSTSPCTLSPFSYCRSCSYLHA